MNPHNRPEALGAVPGRIAASGAAVILFVSDELRYLQPSAQRRRVKNAVHLKPNAAFIVGALAPLAYLDPLRGQLALQWFQMFAGFHNLSADRALASAARHSARPAEFLYVRTAASSAATSGAHPQCLSAIHWIDGK